MTTEQPTPDPIAGARAAAASDVGALAPVVIWSYLGAMVKAYDELRAQIADDLRELRPARVGEGNFQAGWDAAVAHVARGAGRG